MCRACRQAIESEWSGCECSLKDPVPKFVDSSVDYHKFAGACGVRSYMTSNSEPSPTRTTGWLPDRRQPACHPSSQTLSVARRPSGRCVALRMSPEVAFRRAGSTTPVVPRLASSACPNAALPHLHLPEQAHSIAGRSHRHTSGCGCFQSATICRLAPPALQPTSGGKSRSITSREIVQSARAVSRALPIRRRIRPKSGRVLKFPGYSRSRRSPVQPGERLLAPTRGLEERRSRLA